MNSACLFLVVIALMSGTRAQSIPRCKELLEGLAERNIRVFENADGTQNIVSEICVNFTDSEFR